MSSNYAGIDWSGPGSTTNRDVATGIRYGVISQNSIQSDVMSGIWQESRDLSYEAAKEELENSIYRVMQNAEDEDRKDGLKSALGDLYYGDRRSAELEDACGEIIDIWDEFLGDTLTEADRLAIWEVVSDRFGDTYESGDGHDWLWEKDGYTLSNCLQSDVFVGKSPYFTYAQFCSPCVPGAGNLDNSYEPQGKSKEQIETVKHVAPLALGEAIKSWAEQDGYPQVFCLGHDFFDNEEAPYPVFSVATGKRVLPGGEE
jgi:hypothetical protein